MEYKNLSILGTSHIARQSLEQVKQKIESHKPDIVALELDKQRLMALFAKPQKREWLSLGNIRHIGIQGLLFNIFGAIVEKKLGKMVGVKPGSEMKLAYQIAQQKKLRVALIDQPIEKTLRNFSKKFTWKEKFRLVADLFKGLFQKGPKLKIDLTKVPEEKMIEFMIKEVKHRYPNFYKVLVQDRNKVMANNLAALMKMFPDKKILAIVGAGHGKDIIRLIKQKI
jgi:pheromone shutdown-related protein TraB